MNSTLSLIRYAKLDKGWRRAPVVMQTNGRIKHPYMLIAGQEVNAPQGRYQLVHFEGSRPIYTKLTDNPTDALARYKAESRKHAARVEAVTAARRAGLEIVADYPAQRPIPQSAAKDKGKTLSQYAENFLEMHYSLPHRSDDSANKYKQITSSFLSCNPSLQYPEDVRQEHIIRWCGWMRDKKGYADRTRSSLYQSLRGWLRYCGLDPAKIVDRGTHTLLLKYTTRTPNMYMAEQVAALIANAQDADEALLWEFAHKTGVRESELRMVTRDDLLGLDGDTPVLHVRERDEYGRIKDAAERIVALHPSLQNNLKNWLKYNPNRRLLFGTAADKPNNKMLRSLKRTARRAGLNCGHCAGCQSKLQECREYTLHRFRRTYATNMLIATRGDCRTVMSQTGHSDMESLMRYLAPAGQIRDALKKAF